MNSQYRVQAQIRFPFMLSCWKIELGLRLRHFHSCQVGSRRAPSARAVRDSLWTLGCSDSRSPPSSPSGGLASSRGHFLSGESIGGGLVGGRAAHARGGSSTKSDCGACTCDILMAPHRSIVNYRGEGAPWVCAAHRSFAAGGPGTTTNGLAVFRNEPPHIPYIQHDPRTVAIVRIPALLLIERESWVTQA